MTFYDRMLINLCVLYQYDKIFIAVRNTHLSNHQKTLTIILNTSLAFIELQNFSQFLFPQNIVTMDIFMDILGNGSV